MIEYQSCKKAIQDCIENHHFSIAHLYSEEQVMDMHIHDCYEIYYSISGGKQFLIDNRYYNIEPGNVFVINQYESHYISQVDKSIHERIIINIHPELCRSLSTPQTDLTTCFTNRRFGCSHRLVLTKEQQDRFRYYVHKITSTEGFGSDVIENVTLTELLILLNTVYQSNFETIEQPKQASQYKKQVTAIIDYINLKLCDSITIESLAKHFFLSESYICRIFKAETGTTINKYLTARRISLAKAKLAAGLSVTEVCSLCGFNDYSNFVKSFTKSVGVTPKRYSMFNEI